MPLHYRDEGEGEPIVLVHGLGASSRVFDPLFERRGNRRLIAVDLPRTGRSRHWASSTPGHIADALVKFLEGRGVKRFELFGHSFGGLVALALAGKYGERVTKLTVAAAPALGAPPELKLLLANPMLEMSASWFGRMPGWWRPMLRGYLQFLWGDPRRLEEHHLEVYEQAISADGFGEGMVEALRAVATFRVPHETIAAAPFPKTVLWGDRDRLVSVVQGEQLARAIGGELKVLPDVGHCIPEEHPAALDEHLGRNR